MSNRPILSIIVPAYNAEKTLSRCVDSLLNQNDASIEIIISNDGSTDGTQDIIDIYVENNSKVFGVCNSNGGVSFARNRGMTLAKGQWIAFVDSDDYVEPGVFKKIVDILSATNPDMLEYQYMITTEENDYSAVPNRLPKSVLLDSEWLKNAIIPALLNISCKKEYFIENYVWNKVFRTEIIRAHDVYFDENRRKWEDRLFCLSFLRYASTFYSMPEYGYHYVCGSGQSLSGKFDPEILKIIMDSYQKYRKMYGHEYCFDNEYTISYFCNLLIDVAKDQFSYQLSPDDLKKMFFIFVEDLTVQKLFLSFATQDKLKQLIRKAVVCQDVNEVYSAIKRYAFMLRLRERKRSIWVEIRHLLSCVKKAVANGQ